MKYVTASAVLCCALACAMLCFAEPAPTTRKSAPTTRPASTQPVAINKFCAVDRDNPVDDSVPTITYKGKVIGFCCDDCPPKFKKNPELYMKDLK